MFFSEPSFLDNCAKVRYDEVVLLHFTTFCLVPPAAGERFGVAGERSRDVFELAG